MHEIMTPTGRVWVKVYGGNVWAYDWDRSVSQADIDAAVESVRASL